MRTRAAVTLLACLAAASPLAAQEQEDFSAVTTVTADGAVYDEKMGVDGTLITEAYLLTRLTCHKGSKDVDLLMAMPRDFLTDADGNMPPQTNGHWMVNLKAGKKRLVKPVTFVAINDPVSNYKEGTQVTIAYGDPVWRALTAPHGDQLLAEFGTFAQAISISPGKPLRQFEKACGLKR